MLEVDDRPDQSRSGRKLAAVFVGILINLGILLLCALISTTFKGHPDPKITAQVAPQVKKEEPKMTKRKVEKMARQSSSSPASAASVKMLRANATASIALPEVTKTSDVPLGFGDGDFGDGFGSGGNGSGAGGMGGFGGPGKKIGGLTVKAEKLGVILDTSGSMTKHIEKLRKEIGKEFEAAVFREVVGCRLAISDGTNIEELDPKDPKRGSVMTAMRELAEIENVDAIFWFCDLNDGESEEALKELDASLWHGKPPVRTSGSKGPAFSGLDKLKKLQDRSEMEKKDQPCRLYIRSVGKRAEGPLMRVLRGSGGAFKRS